MFSLLEYKSPPLALLMASIAFSTLVAANPDSSLPTADAHSQSQDIHIDTLASASSLEFEFEPCQLFQKSNAWTDFKLGASYLFNPRVARSAKVVWTYPASDSKSLALIASGADVESLYVSDLDNSGKIHIKLFSLPKVEESDGNNIAWMRSFWTGYVASVNNELKDIEIGVVTGQSTVEGISSNGKYISWGIETDSDPHIMKRKYSWMAAGEAGDPINFAMGHSIAAGVNNCLESPVLEMGSIKLIE